jgi:hypothetical protein
MNFPYGCLARTRVLKVAGNTGAEGGGVAELSATYGRQSRRYCEVWIYFLGRLICCKSVLQRSENVYIVVN